MNFFNEVIDQGRRVTVDVFSGGGIERDAPYSPDVPEDLRQWLPDLFDRFPVVLPWEKPRPVDPALDNVWILDNTAFRTPASNDPRPHLKLIQDDTTTDAMILDSAGNASPARESSGWEAEFVACFFLKNSGKNVAGIVADLARKLDVDENDVATRRRIAHRLQPFLDTVLPLRTLRVNISNHELQTLGPSNYSGISSTMHALHLPSPSPSSPLSTSAVHLPPPFSLAGSTFLAEETGWAVISDIDDTIKVTQTPSALGILKTTFLVAEPDPIPGMPAFYSHLSSTLSRPPFFYLSASPYNLYPFLRTFLHKNYPPGTTMLRDASWQNLGGLISSLQNNVQAYKIAHIRKIHTWFPHRSFICVGDSTQFDPESYGQCAREFPGWIRAIFIHKVTGIAEMEISEKNRPERFEKAFRGLDRNLWHVYTDPAELVERVEGLARDPKALVGGP